MTDTTALVMALTKAQGSMDRHAEAKALPALIEHRHPRRRVNHITGGTLQQRFWAKIAWGATDCWYWRAHRDGGGYGVVHDGHAKRAHRLSWELFHGAIPPGMKVLHRCDVRNCVNPDHLFLGTQAENVADMMAKGRGRAVPQCGECNPMSVLSAAAVLQIRADFESRRATMRQLARHHGVAVMTVFRIVRRQTWKGL